MANYRGNLKIQGVLNIPEEKGESALPKHGSISSSSKHVILDISTTKD
jgi:3-oxoacyl-[acyl-carrier-protein] synthase III